MRRVEEWHPELQGVPEGLDELVNAAREVDHHKPLGEHALAELKAGPQEMPHAAFVVRDDDKLIGYAHVSYRETLSGWRFEFVTHPSYRGQGVATMLVRHVLDHVAWDGGGTLHTWAPEDADAARARLIRRFDLEPIRRLHQQHTPLPLGPVPLPSGFTVRAFASTDIDQWLRLHNEVFAGHPDAGGWREVDLAWRMGEPWFDAEGFHLVFDDEGLAGYNWVKLHDHEGAAHDEDDPDTKIVGEIYMLGIAPRAQGTGLSRAIAVRGLAWAWSNGATRAMLYVDESNRVAQRLYRGIGFTTTHVDTCFSLNVPAAHGSGGPHR